MNDEETDWLNRILGSGDVRRAARLRVTGTVFAPIRVSLPRARYSAMLMGGRSGSLFEEAAARLNELHGDRVLEGLDGLAFVHEGENDPPPGTALRPHRSTVKLGRRRLPYYVHSSADAIGVHCYEFGHLLGLSDEYGVGHRTGSGDFCLMAIGHRGGGRTGARSPFSLCGWCRMRLGWLRPTVVDPRVPQRLRLAPSSRGKDQLVAVSESTAGREHPSIYYVVWHDQPTTAGPATFINELIEIAGGRNVFADAPAQWPQVSLETIVSRQPDVIVLPSGDDQTLDLRRLRARVGWRDLRAVREGRVIHVDAELFNRPGPRVAEAARQLAQLLRQSS